MKGIEQKVINQLCYASCSLAFFAKKMHIEVEHRYIHIQLCMYMKKYNIIPAQRER